MGVKGVVAAGHELTALAAAEILREGGNAFDAALAATCAACVAEPVLASLGGGGFLLARTADGDCNVYDFFVHTPRKRRPVDELDFRPVEVDFGSAQQHFRCGLGSIATPGVVKGLFEIHRDLGSMPMPEIVQPAVGFARQGVTINPFQAYVFSLLHHTYTSSPEVLAVFQSPGDAGCLVGTGELLRLPAMADTLEALAREGDALFYLGEIASSIAARSEAGGGCIGRDDLAGYRVRRRRPLLVDYRGARVLTNPPPACGGALIAFGLKLLAEVSQPRTVAGSTERLHLLADVMVSTNKARVDIMAARASDEGLELDAALLRRYRDEVLGRRQSLRGTTHLNVIDAAGNVASLTLSNGEGSGFVVPGTGIMLNNMLGEEDLMPEGFHNWPTDQRLTSMMSPTVVELGDGGVIATGSGGSKRIRTSILQVLVNLLDHGMDVERAVASPRLFIEEGTLCVEGGFDPAALAPLLREYPQHRVWGGLNLFFGGAHTIQRRGGAFSGAGDERRSGVYSVVS